MSNLQSVVGSMVADNWTGWTGEIRASLWRTFNQAEREAIWAEYCDQPEYCPEPPPVVSQDTTKPGAVYTTEALRRFDELVASIQFEHPVKRAEVAQVERNPVIEYAYTPPDPKPQPAPQNDEPGHLTTFWELPTETKLKAAVNVIGWILIIWFMIRAFG